MASLKLAMEIEPSKTAVSTQIKASPDSPVRPDQSVESTQPQKGGQEPFRRILERAEKDGASDSKPVTDRVADKTPSQEQSRSSKTDHDDADDRDGNSTGPSPPVRNPGAQDQTQAPPQDGSQPVNPAPEVNARLILAALAAGMIEQMPKETLNALVSATQTPEQVLAPIEFKADSMGVTTGLPVDSPTSSQAQDAVQGLQVSPQLKGESGVPIADLPQAAPNLQPVPDRQPSGVVVQPDLTSLSAPVNPTDKPGGFLEPMVRKPVGESVAKGPDKPQAKVEPQTDRPKQATGTSSDAPQKSATDQVKESGKLVEFVKLLNPKVEQETAQTAFVRKEQPIQPVVVSKPDSASKDASQVKENSRQDGRELLFKPDQVRPQSTPLLLTSLDKTVPVLDKLPVDIYGAAYKPLIGRPLETIAQTTPGQPAAVAQTDSVSTIANAGIKLDSAKLVADVREAVISMASDGRTQARLVLHPPELGELVVRLESAKNGIMRAEFHTMSPLVRETLEAGISKLIDALKSEGLTLNQAEVYLSFNLGTHGQSGESASDSQNQQSAFSGREFETVDMTGPVEIFDRLPDGATISLLA
jgi:flagellar hook-length control protein FliK